MRERIKVELSDFFRNEIMLPGAIQEYKVGFHEMILLNKAYAMMLAGERLIDAQTAATIIKGLEEVSRTLKKEHLDGKYEELYFNVEQALFKIIPVETGGKLHTGRSRNDIYATLWRMEVRRSLWEVFDELIGLQETLFSAAKKNIGTVMTGYTHTQPAQPITLAHYYTAVCNALNRDFTRLSNAYRTTNACPYGSAALAGTGFPINRGRLEELLGFKGLVVNSLDCVGGRDYALEAESALAILMVTVSRVAQDHYLWATDEFGILDVGGEMAVSSSIMPQKKNPVSLELAKAKAAHSLAAFADSATVLKNTPFSMCMDLFESTGPYWKSHSEALQALGLLRETIGCSKINKERALERARKNFSTVTALADYLVSRFGISFAQAHNIVGSMVARVIEEGSLMSGMCSSFLKEASQEVIGEELDLTDETIQKVLDPTENVNSKKSIGGPSKESVRSMLDETERYMAEEKSWLLKERDRVTRAYAKLKEEEARICKT